MIYLDNNATTQPSEAVVSEMNRWLTSEYANPSSAYSFAGKAANAIEVARRRVADLLGAANPKEICFTSGGTESDNWALLGSLEARPEKTKVVTSSVEHEAVRVVAELLESRGYESVFCGVDENGQVSIDEVLAAVDERTAVVSLMLANNETGVLFPVEEIAARVKEKSDAWFHVDGVNAAGKVPINLKKTEIDLFSISAHKFHGPKGIGALYIKDGIDLPPRNLGGKQENSRRAGTEAVHQIAGLGVAAKLASDIATIEKIGEMRDRFENFVVETFPNAIINGRTSQRLPNTSNVSFPGLNGELILGFLDEKGICVSTGSACNESDHVTSPVLRAMGVPYKQAMGTLRFSFGRNNDPDELPNIFEAVHSAVQRASKIAGRD